MTTSKDITSTEFPRVKTQRELWDAWQAPETLEENVRLFFEIMDTKEYSDMSDREFHPTRFNAEDRCIDSCRVWDTHRLNKIMKRMKELCSSPIPTTEAR
jgi:hypothetical protein